MEAEARFWAKVDKRGPNDCWEWNPLAGRYGNFLLNGKQMGAHRASWTLAHGEIPKGLHVLHMCDNTACVNPAHLWLGTSSENMRDMVRKGRHQVPMVCVGCGNTAMMCWGQRFCTSSCRGRTRYNAARRKAKHDSSVEGRVEGRG